MTQLIRMWIESFAIKISKIIYKNSTDDKSYELIQARLIIYSMVRLYGNFW